MGRWFGHVAALLLALIWLAGCADGNEGGVALMPASATPRPTPTLAVLARLTAPPTPAITPSLTPIPPTPTPTTTPSPTPSPTATPQPAAWLAQAERALAHQDYATAIDAFQASLAAAADLSPDEQARAHMGLTQAYLGVELWAEARDAVQPLLPATDEPPPLLPQATGDHPQAAQFLLALAAAAQGDCPTATAAYEAYLRANPDMAAYVQPHIAACDLLLDDRDAAIAAYEAAAVAPAHRLTIIDLRETLAGYYLQDGDFAAAMAQYDAIADLAVTDYTLGQVTFLAGSAALQAGDTEGAYARFRLAVNNYPRSYDSYQALVALVQAEEPVDAFQRGLVDYYAGVYVPAIDAFTTALANPDPRPDIPLYLAWCYAQLGDLDAALAQMDAYALLEPAAARIETARLYARAGLADQAIAAYESYVADFPDGPDAAQAAWSAAALSEQQGDLAGASARYRQMAAAYDWHEDAPEAMFRAGWLAWEARDEEAAFSAWSAAVAQYPAADYGAAALLWLLQRLPADAPVLPDLRAQAAAWPGVGYYTLRLRQVVAGAPPFSPATTLTLTADGTLASESEEALTTAAAWLADWWGATGNLQELSPALAEDDRLRRGAKLWQLGLYAEASRELDQVRQDYVQDALASYRLAVWFRDRGIYRLSILAAAAVQYLSDQAIFALPPHLARLLYPTYYADLILPLAREYDFDPLLQLALVRQESLFESFATSSAVAQGLSQVIPDTGVYIAQRLQWPDYENEDLYKPYVGLRFGAFYLAEQLRAFDGHVYAALAAYNAGPGNAARWEAQAPQDPDLFVEAITFAETRLYVERIFVGYQIYHALYSQPSR